VSQRAKNIFGFRRDGQKLSGNNSPNPFQNR